MVNHGQSYTSFQEIYRRVTDHDCAPTLTFCNRHALAGIKLMFAPSTYVMQPLRRNKKWYGLQPVRRASPGAKIKLDQILTSKDNAYPNDTFPSNLDHMPERTMNSPPFRGSTICAGDNLQMSSILYYLCLRPNGFIDRKYKLFPYYTP